MRTPGGAIAVFVKTPGLSPVKTRLGESIGKIPAEEFHLISAKAVAAAIKQAQLTLPLKAYWAVAEPEALFNSQWKDFETISQGEGSLGERLSRVYDELLSKHPFVLLIGADTPQLNPEILTRSAALLTTSEWCMGKSNDGGFYLFGGARPLSIHVWKNVQYSQRTTASELESELEILGKISYLPFLSDIDLEEDLFQFYAEYKNCMAFLPEQKALILWIERFLSGF